MNRHQVISFSSRFLKAPLEKLIKRLQVVQTPLLPGSHLAQISPQFHKAGVFLDFLPLLPGQNLIDFREHEAGALVGFSLGGTGGLLARKLVKPSKVFCSGHRIKAAAIDSCFPKHSPILGAARAGVLGEADAAMGQELGCTRSGEWLIRPAARIPAIAHGDGGMEILNFGQALAHEHD